MKIVTLQEVKRVADQLRHDGKSLVVAGGCFDLLHIGHITLLENAKKEGDILFVLLESDESIRQRKGIDRPIHTQEERAKLLSSLQAVDVVVMLSNDMHDTDYDKLLNDIHPSIIATTENDEGMKHKERQAKQVDARVVAVNKYIPSVSTTKLVDILEKEM